MSDSALDYKTLLTKTIKDQINILGPSITLAKVNHVQGISVANDGSVTSLTENPEVVINQLLERFSELSPFIAKKTLSPLLKQTHAEEPPQEADRSQSETNLQNEG